MVGKAQKTNGWPIKNKLARPTTTEQDLGPFKFDLVLKATWQVQKGLNALKIALKGPHIAREANDSGYFFILYIIMKNT